MPYIDLLDTFVKSSGLHKFTCVIASGVAYFLHRSFPVRHRVQLVPSILASHSGCGRDFRTLGAVMHHLESEVCGYTRFATVQQGIRSIVSGDRTERFLFRERLFDLLHALVAVISNGLDGSRKVVNSNNLNLRMAKGGKHLQDIPYIHNSLLLHVPVTRMGKGTGHYA